MCKNIVEIMFENKLPEHLCDLVIDYHGGVEAWLPDELCEVLNKTSRNKKL